MKKYISFLWFAFFSAAFILLVSLDWLYLTSEEKVAVIEVTSGNENAVSGEGEAELSGGYDEKTLEEADKLFELLSSKYGKNIREGLKDTGYVDNDLLLKTIVLGKVVDRMYQQNEFDAVVTIVALTPIEQRIKANIQFNYALALTRLEQRNLAKQEYKQLILADPSHQNAAINLGLLYSKDGEFVKGIRVLEHAIDISAGEKKAKALAILAGIYKKQDQFSKAENLFKQSLEYRPAHGKTWLRLAQVQETLEMPYEIVSKTYRRATALLPQEAKAWQLGGEYALAKSDFWLARAMLKKAYKLSSSNPGVRQSLAWVYLELGKKRTAKKHWKWLKQNALEKYDRLLAAHIVAALNDQDNSLKPLSSKSLYGLYAQAMLADLKGDKKLAKEKFNLLLVDDNKSYTARAAHRLLRGLSTFDGEKLKAYNNLEDEIARYYQVMLSQNSYMPAPTYPHAIILHKTGMFDFALAKVDDALSYAPDNINFIKLKIEVLISMQLLNEANKFIADLPDSIKKSKTITKQLGYIAKLEQESTNNRTVLADKR